MRQQKRCVLIAATLAGIAGTTPTMAGVTVYENGEKFVKIGGRIQLQYHQADPASAKSTDEVFFRRLRPYIEGSVHEGWKAKFQWDMGKAEDDNEVAVKDAYLQYSGMERVKITLGNANFPFSREFLTSSKKQQLVERTFVGDHNYGTPDRNVGLHVTGHNAPKTLTWGLSGAAADIDPDDDKLDFDTPVNRNSDFNQGWIVGGRVDFHPFGLLKFSQGDFGGGRRATVGAAVFAWSNDDDNNLGQAGKPDVDTVTGLEVSGALRGGGFSVDAQYNNFNAETVGGTYSGGLYKAGETELESWAVEGGYMVIPGRFELVAGYQSQDADGYESAWKRTSLGGNWFIQGHDIKLQLSYRKGENVKGRSGADEDEVFLQAQYVF